MPFLFLLLLAGGTAVAVDQLTSEDFASSFTGAIFAYFLRELAGVGSTFVDYLFDSLPEDPEASYSVIYTYVNYIAYWVPIDFCLGVLGVWFLFQASVIVVRWTMKIIPGIG